MPIISATGKVEAAGSLEPKKFGASLGKAERPYVNKWETEGKSLWDGLVVKALVQRPDVNSVPRSHKITGESLHTHTNRQSNLKSLLIQSVDP